MYHTDHRIQLQQRPLSITLLYNDDFIPRVCLRKISNSYRLTIDCVLEWGAGADRPPAALFQ